MPDERKTPLDEMKGTIVTSAAEAVVQQMTPTQMRRVAEQVIEETLAGIRTDKYSALGKLVERKTEEALAEYLATEEVTARIRFAVRHGVDAAIDSMSDEVKGRVVDVALKGLCEALTKARR